MLRPFAPVGAESGEIEDLTKIYSELCKQPLALAAGLIVSF